MIIGLFAQEEDRPYLQRLQPLMGANAVKVTTKPEEYLAGIKLKIEKAGLDAIICSCPETLVTLLNTQADFRHPLDKRGLKKRLSLNDYAGSFFYIPGYKVGKDTDVPVLVLNSASHLVKTAEGPFIFKRFLSKLLDPNRWFPQTQFTWETWTHEKSQQLLDRFLGARILSVDIETYIGDPLRRIHCVGYCALFPDGTTHSLVVPFKTMEALRFVRKLNACAVPKLFQNGLYDNAYFARFNVPCSHWFHDTQHQFHSWYSELPKRLDFITAFMVREIRYWKDDSAGGEFELFEYNARDCWATLMTYLAATMEVPEYAVTNYLIEFPLVFPALHTELDGLKVNRKQFDEQRTRIEAKLDLVRRRIAIWFGEKFNPGSPVQVKNLLSVLGIRDPESSDEKHLVAASALHPFNELVLSEILEYRGLAKLLSTYFVWDKFWNDRLHYKTNPAGTDTGRLASTESSFWCGLQIQNITRDGGVKNYIECDPAWDGLGEGDYAQSEARCVGYISGCESLIQLVESSHDYHSWNASAFFGIPYEEIWDEETGKAKNKPLRDLSKRVNHGSNYNMGERVLLDTMGPKAVVEAKRLLNLPASFSLLDVCRFLLSTYVRTYPEVKGDYYEWVKRTVKLTKKMVSDLGWTRYFFSDPTASKMALNACVAHRPQNLSVGIINEVYYKIWHDSVYGDLRGRVRVKAQIHDSIFFAYRGEEVPEIVRTRMVNPKVITDVRGKKRTMLIPPDMSAFRMKEGKVVHSKFWADLK